MRIKAMGALAALACGLALTACGGSSNSSSSSDVTAFCDKVHELRQLSNPFASVKPGDVEGAKAALDKVISEVGSVEAVAPDAIKSDINSVKNTMSDFASKLKSAKTPADVVQVAQGFRAESASVQGDVAKINKYTRDNCGNK